MISFAGASSISRLAPAWTSDLFSNAGS
jgi:hypothetical protein